MFVVLSDFFWQIPESLFQNTLKCLVDVVISETAPLASVAMQALGHIGLRVSLPPVIIDSNSGEFFVPLLKSSVLNCSCNIFAPRLEISLTHITLQLTF